jgi:hypothetical protein
MVWWKTESCGVSERMRDSIECGGGIVAAESRVSKESVEDVAVAGGCCRL